MIDIVALVHAGNCTPLYLCELVAQSKNALVVHLDKSSFTTDHLSLMKGAIDPSRGVTVVYMGKPEDWIPIRDAAVKYVTENRTGLAEEWQSWQVKRGTESTSPPSK